MARKKVSDPSTRGTRAHNEQRLRTAASKLVKDAAKGRIPPEAVKSGMREAGNEITARNQAQREADARAKRTIIRRTKDSTKL